MKDSNLEQFQKDLLDLVQKYKEDVLLLAFQISPTYTIGPDTANFVSGVLVRKELEGKFETGRLEESLRKVFIDWHLEEDNAVLQ